MGSLLPGHIYNEHIMYIMYNVYNVIIYTYNVYNEYLLWNGTINTDVSGKGVALVTRS